MIYLRQKRIVSCEAAVPLQADVADTTCISLDVTITCAYEGSMQYYYTMYSTHMINDHRPCIITYAYMRAPCYIITIQYTSSQDKKVKYHCCILHRINTLTMNCTILYYTTPHVTNTQFGFPAQENRNARRSRHGCATSH